MANFIEQNKLQQKYRFDIKFYIKDNNGEWVDFSDRSNSAYGVNKLLSVGKISNRIEVGFGSLVTTVQDVILDNSDGFFNAPFPSWLKTIGGSTASFSLSKNGKRTVLRGKICKVSAQVRLPNNEQIVGNETTPPKPPSVDVVQEETLGIFSIDELVPDIKNGKMKVKVVSLDQLLQNKSAEGIKNGYDWFESRSVSFLIEEILKSEFSESGSLPSTFAIDKTPYLDTIDGSTVVSNIGRPPLWDGSVWRNDGLYTRALCHADVNSSGDKLYLGCDEQLWSYDASTGVYTSIDTSTIPAGYYIKFLDYDSTNDLLVIGCWYDEYFGARASRIDAEGWKYRIYTWDGTTLTHRTPTQRYIMSMCYGIRPGYVIYVTNGGYVWQVIAGSLGGDDLYSVDDNGESIYVPFPQHIQVLEHFTGMTQTPNIQEAGGDIHSAPDSEATAFSHNDQIFFNVTKNLCSYFGRISNSTPSPEQRLQTGLIYHIGQEPCVMLSNRNIVGTKYLYSFILKEVDNGDPWRAFFAKNPWGPNESWFYLQCHGVNAVGTLTFNVPTIVRLAIPTCMAVNGSGNLAYSFFQNIKGGNTGNANEYSVMVPIDLTDNITPFNTPVEYSGSFVNTTIVNVKFFSSNDGISTTADKGVLVLLDRLTKQYKLAYTTVDNLSSTSMISNCTILRTSSQAFSALAIDSVDDCIYAYEMGAGKIFKITKAGAISAINETPAIKYETGLLSNLTVKQSHASNTPEIYGVSSPTTHLTSQYVYPVGKYALFRVHQSISDIVEYADFSDMTKFEAIKALVQSRDGISFFNRDGYFNYIQRPRTTTQIGSSDYTFGLNDSNTNVIDSVSLDYGYDRVFNQVKTTPFYVKVEEPTSEISLLERTDKNTAGVNNKNAAFVDFVVEQRDNTKKMLRLYCVSGGKTDDGESRWKYTIISNEIEAILATATTTTTQTSLVLNSVFGGDGFVDGIHTGDFISVFDLETNELITRNITSVTEATNTIVVQTGGFGIILPEKTVFIISRGFQIDNTYTRAFWSDEGVTYINDTPANGDTTLILQSVANLSTSTVVRFGTSQPEHRITAIDKDTSEITFTPALATATLPSNEDKVFAFWSPETTDGSEVGGSNIYISFTAGVGTENEDYSKTFIPGDRITIDAPGRVLEEEAAATQLIVDAGSKQKHGPIEFLLDNRFLDTNIAREIARRIITYGSEPKFGMQITMPIIPYVDVLVGSGQTVVSVRDPFLFPTSNDFLETFLVNGVDHNLKDLTTTLYLTGTTDY